MRLVGRSGAAARLADAAESFPVRVRFEEPKRLSALIRNAVDAYASTYRRTGVSVRGEAPVPA